LVVGLLGGAVVMGVMEANSSARIPRGKPAPQFSVERLTGGTVTLADYKGKAVMVAFWGTWCPPCREELPGLVKLADEYQSKGATLLAINDYNEDAANMPAFVKEQLPGLRPYAAAGNEKTFETYGVDTFPTLYVIDPHGNVVASVDHRAEMSTVRHWVDEALKR
jgi:peroxiredoxin